ncbi:hypothetical protein L6164_017390 [Bauhinia variegata]|uniref:Uncharacterized protein n=1 Tax=Bauhinia variegata TaxID=167791 RepID=A0ACB9N930_BAUVA|nr:hypothetical protein L6164_017390 [Bauhinia variegata]
MVSQLVLNPGPSTIQMCRDIKAIGLEHRQYYYGISLIISILTINKEYIVSKINMSHTNLVIDVEAIMVEPESPRHECCINRVPYHIRK